MTNNLENNDIAQEWWFPTRKENLNTILASGAVYLAADEFRHREDMRDIFGGIPLFKGGCPKDWDVKQGVVLRFKRDVFDVLGDGVEQRGVNQVISSRPIPLSRLEAISFSDESSAKDTLARLPMNIEPWESYFQPIPPANTYDVDHAPESLAQAPSKTKFSRTKQDRIIGAYLLSRHLASKTTDGLSQLCGLWNALAVTLLQPALEIGAEWRGEEDELGNLIETAFDEWLLQELLMFVSQAVPGEGFSRSKLVKDLKEKAPSFEGDAAKAAKTWFERIEALLLDSHDIPPLPDTSLVLQRAAFVFIYRNGAADRISELHKSQQLMGERVRIVAGALAGLYCGTLGLSDDVKGLLGDFLGLAEAVLVQGDRKVAAPVFTTSFESVGALVSRGTIKVVSSDLPVVHWDVEPPPLVSRIYYQAREAGYELLYDPAEGDLVFRLNLEEARKQEVRISMLAQKHGATSTIRFSSPCMKLSSLKDRKLTKELALKLLARNVDPLMTSRFAIEANSDGTCMVVVVADQLADTMDRDEFIAHLEGVGRVADEFEREISGGKDIF